MKIIYKELIKKYIYLLQPQDIKNYADSKKIDLNLEEVMIIYNFIKTYYNELLEKNIEVFSMLEKQVRYDIYVKIIELYNYYKKYI